MTAHRHIYRQKRTAVLILRVLHGGELSGELLLSARRAYSTAERVTDTSSLEHTVLPEGEKARYIRVQIGKQGFASIFEIEVYGRE
ncbi:MAG: hypothetical protein KHX22_10150 [Clostridiales bacterium]|nr:hypothetical protein [Clostridiales bacterium]PWM21286.1 MAG: hypothetical protein DBX53_06675 [Clostridiales bacterium]